MVLDELRGRLTRTFRWLDNIAVIDETVMKEITGALVDADFPILLVNEIERKIQKVINVPTASDKLGRIYLIVADELISRLDPGKSAVIQEKREPSVVMFVGLRGVQMTDMCAKYAIFHRKKGFRPALVCADASRTDALLRLEKAAKDEVPVYGSYSPDPATIAREGIEKFTKEKRDLIIVATNGRHKRYSALFQEMRQLADAMKPDLVIFVMDTSIGQAAMDQAQAFKQSFDAGVVILANMMGNSKADGAIAAVAAAKCPMILAETGEDGKEFEAFEVVPFVKSLMHHHEYTLRKMYESYQSQLGLGNQWFLCLLSGMAASRPQEHQNLEKMRRYMTIMDSMTDKELDVPNLLKQMSEKRVIEIAKGSKVEVRQVVEMMKRYKSKAKAWKEMREKCGTR